MNGLHVHGKMQSEWRRGKKGNKEKKQKRGRRTAWSSRNALWCRDFDEMQTAEPVGVDGRTETPSPLIDRCWDARKRTAGIGSAGPRTSWRADNHCVKYALCSAATMCHRDERTVRAISLLEDDWIGSSGDGYTENRAPKWLKSAVETSGERLLPVAETKEKRLTIARSAASSLLR